MARHASLASLPAVEARPRSKPCEPRRTTNMGRLIVVSNRVATPTETKGSAGGLAVGVFGALKDAGGVWFGWSGDVVSETVANAGPTLEQDGAGTFATPGLPRHEYDHKHR